jgi:gliding motility-associated protein GldM
MAGGNISPRQKMINMMYLVLTALLALNVSAEILKAFHLVEVSLEKSAINIEAKNQAVMKAINKYHEEFPNDSNGNIVFVNAKKAREIANELVNYIGELKEQVIAGADGRKEDTNGDGIITDEELTKPDDIENHANLLINQKRGEELRTKINETREKLIALIPKDKAKSVNSDLITEDYTEEGQKKTWESVMFEHSPAAAVVTLLTKFQGDVRNTEAQVLDILKSMISESDFTFDKLEPKVIPNNGTYITLGSEYSADIFVAASSSKQEATIEVNGKVVPVEGGIGKYKVVPTTEGEIKYKGIIKAKKPNGEEETYPFEQSFTALKPLAVISATKMNVVYIGLDNPISVSVPGYSPAELQVSINPSSAGTWKQDKQAGTYLFKPNSSAKEVVVVASVTKNGKTTKMGEQRYRIKQVPKPIPMLGSIEASGSYAAGVIKSSTFVYAALKDFAFEGISYKPVKFTLIYQPRKGDGDFAQVNGQGMDAKAKQLLNKAKSGDRFTLTQVFAAGPAGTVILPTALAIEVK